MQVAQTYGNVVNLGKLIANLSSCKKLGNENLPFSFIEA
jgi:hypothetical protein